MVLDQDQDEDQDQLFCCKTEIIMHENWRLRKRVRGGEVEAVCVV